MALWVISNILIYKFGNLELFNPFCWQRQVPDWAILFFFVIFDHDLNIELLFIHIPFFFKWTRSGCETQTSLTLCRKSDIILNVSNGFFILVNYTSVGC